MNGPTAVPLSMLSTYIIGQQTGLTYLWNATNGIIASGQGTNMVQVSWGATAGIGIVKVKLTSAAGCVDSTVLNVQIGSTGVQTLGQSFPFKLYPNPSNNLITISSGKQNLKGAAIKIYDMIGKLVLSEIAKTDNSVELSILHLANGTYLLEVEKDGEISRTKLLKE